MTKEKTPEIITNKDDQTDPIVLNMQSDQLTVNKNFNQVLAEVPDIVDRGNKLLKTDINEIDEDEMTKLNREFKPIINYEKKFKSFRDAIKKKLRERDENVINSLDSTLEKAGFNEIPEMTKKLRQLQKDFKANRANQRWEQLEQLFNAQMDTYPELKKYAPTTLGDFNYYRVHHADLVSEAKTKPVTNTTIKQLNEDLNNYHNDLTHLLESTLGVVYYKNVIDQYAAEPTTNNMLNLIDIASAQQIKDQNTKLLQTVEVKAKSQITKLWYNNKIINDLLNTEKADKQKPDEFQATKAKLMKLEANAMLKSLQFEKFLQNGEIQEIEITSTIKTLITDAFNRVKKSLQKNAKDYQEPQIATKKPKVTKPVEPAKPAEVPYKWLLDYLQASGWQKIHGQNKIKVAVLNDLFNNIANKESIWRKEIHSNKEIIETVKYITDL